MAAIPPPSPHAVESAAGNSTSPAWESHNPTGSAAPNRMARSYIEAFTGAAPSSFTVTITPSYPRPPTTSPRSTGNTERPAVPKGRGTPPPRHRPQAPPGRLQRRRHRQSAGRFQAMRLPADQGAAPTSRVRSHFADLCAGNLLDPANFRRSHPRSVISHAKSMAGRPDHRASACLRQEGGCPSHRDTAHPPRIAGPRCAVNARLPCAGNGGPWRDCRTSA